MTFRESRTEKAMAISTSIDELQRERLKRIEAQEALAEAFLQIQTLKSKYAAANSRIAKLTKLTEDLSERLVEVSRAPKA